MTRTRTTTATASAAAGGTKAVKSPRAGRAPNGAGSATPRTLADGLVVYDVFWTYRAEDGSRKRAWECGFTSAREAEKHRRAMTSTVDTGRFVAPQDMTVAEYLAEWIEGQRLKPQTRAGYRRKIRIQIIPHIGHLPLGQVRPHCHNER